MKKIFLIGKNISYSLSPQIHAQICRLSHSRYFYGVKSVSEDEARELLRSREYDGMNVTVPYKKIAAEECDVLSEEALATGSVNTVVNKKGVLYGFNTDIFGFAFASSAAGFDYKDAKVLILGTGGAACSVRYALMKAGAGEIRMISRSGKAPDNYESLEYHYDADYIINATPVGMTNYGTDAAPTDLAPFVKLKGVFDLIYSPAETKLLAQASGLGIHASNGLVMLIAQAVSASMKFTGKKLTDEETSKMIIEISKM